MLLRQKHYTTIGMIVLCIVKQSTVPAWAVDRFAKLPVLLPALARHVKALNMMRVNPVRCEDVNILPFPTSTTNTYYSYTTLSLLTPPRIVLRVKQADTA